jgi:hypothetical protein
VVIFRIPLQAPKSSRLRQVRYKIARHGPPEIVLPAFLQEAFDANGANVMFRSAPSNLYLALRSNYVTAGLNPTNLMHDVGMRIDPQRSLA